LATLRDLAEIGDIFIQIRRTLRKSPEMAAGVTDHFWSVADLVALWEREEQIRERAA
jgi:hypothetical protein